MVLIWTQRQKLNYWRVGFKSCLPVKKKIMGCAERSRGILVIYKRGGQFVYRIVTSKGTGVVADTLIIVCFTKKVSAAFRNRQCFDIGLRPPISNVISKL